MTETAASNFRVTSTPLADVLEHLPARFQRDLIDALTVLTRNGATKVILYGSLARHDFSDVSDIDLCVEGLPGAAYFRAVGECLRDIQTPISVTPFENTTGYFRKRILQEGKAIYEQCAA